MKMSIIILILVFILGIFNVNSKEKDINKTLKNVIIKHIEYEGAPINLVVRDLRKRFKNMGNDAKDLNIIISLSKGKRADNYKVSIELDNIPLNHALRYITQTAGLGYFIKDNTIIIADKNIARGKMEIRTFKVRPSSGFINQLSGKK